MRRTVLRSMLLPLLLSACGGAKAPWSAAPAVPIDLKVHVEPNSVPLLEPITVTFDLWRKADLEVEFTPVVDPKDFLVKSEPATERALFGGRWQHTVMTLRPRRGPGELTLPSFVAKAKVGDVAASTPDQKITVTSALEGHGAAIEVPGKPFPTPFRGWWWVAGGALLVLLLGSLLFWRQRVRRAPHAPAAVALPAHVRALRALQRLRQAPRTTLPEIERFYVEVSQVLRVYLEERFGLRAPERTTEEFLRELEGSEALARQHRRELERFLSQCDLVKFAAYVPGEADHLTTFALAEAFVESTRLDRAAVAEVPA